MEQLHLLFLLSFSMLIGSYLSGIIPLSFKLSSSKSRLLALMGSGILVGTALSIIIPEGIDSIYSPAGDESVVGLLPHHNHPLEAPLAADQQQAPPPVQKWVIGVSLVVGFVLMFLIDQFSLYQAGGSVHEPSSRSHSEYLLANQDEEEEEEEEVPESVEGGHNNKPPNKPDKSATFPVNNSQQSNLKQTDSIIDLKHTTTTTTTTTTTSQRNLITNHNTQANGSLSNTKMTPTLGLVIHAAADGIALGAAATTTHRQVEMIIFLAIMLHKAPAAFSLVVFLLHRGLKSATIRRHLLAFSLSAPLAALLTYFGLSQSGKEALRRNNTTGIAMLFSAGTFLYVATVHVLPELVHNKLLSQREMLFLLGGSFLPILLAQTV